jgi:DNA-binding LacI/PurR family transcriptional regulator
MFDLQANKNDQKWGPMLPSARHEAILRELELRGSLEVTPFAQKLGISTMTIRRDLAELESRGLLLRVHGGATSHAMAAQRGPAAPGTASRGGRPIATIGLIVPMSNYYFPAVIRGVREAALELHCRIVLGTSNYSESEEYRQAERLIAAGVDALIITPSRVHIEGTPLHDLLLEAPVPVVVVERAIDERTSGQIQSVRTDHAYGAELAVRHLADLGHERIALAIPVSPTSPWLLEGYSRGMSKLGFDVDAQSIQEIPLPGTGLNATPDALEALLDAWQHDGVTAALVLSDIESVALIELAADRGIRVPDDLSLVAYDDEIAALASVPLTAVSPPKQELGELALRLAFDRIKKGGRTVTRTAMLPTLVERDSTSARTLA